LLYIHYDQKADVLDLRFNTKPYRATRAINDLVAVAVSEDGSVISIEFLRASQPIEHLAVFLAQIEPEKAAQ